MAMMSCDKIKIAFLVCLFAYGSCGIAESAIIAVGKGSYTDTLPSSISAGKRPPVTVYATSNLTGPLPTTKWFSAITSAGGVYAHYAYPLAFCVNNNADSTGLQVGYPNVNAYSSSVDASMKVDFEVRGSIGARYLKADSVKVDAYTDWTVTPLWQDNTSAEYFKATYGHGLAYVYFDFSTGCDPKLVFLNNIESVYDETGALTNGTISTDRLGIKYNDEYYGLFAPTGSTFIVSSKEISITLPAGKRFFSIGLLPSQSDFAYFYQHAYAFVTGTAVTWNYSAANNEVTTDFTVTTEARQGSQTVPLVALLPHQYKHSTAAVSGARTYQTLLGSMKLLEANTFSVSNRFYGVLPFLPDKGSYDRIHLQSLLMQEKDTTLSANDTYFNAKQMAKVANLIPIAVQLGDTATRDYLVSRLKTVLVDWFTYSSGETSRFYYYDSIWKGLVGYNALFSGYNYTDHHFHSGYFVYAAALLSLYDSSFKTDYGPFVEYLVKDYANWQRDDSQFPFLRTFDPYMGHSYCDGLAQSNNGNNQESSSEGMNAWAALILWGMVTNDQAIRDLGVWGYTTEYSAIHDYYFNIDQDIYPSAYKHPCVGILHDAKAEFTTWWTGQAEGIHGIQMIPSTASMLYLGYYPDYCKINYDSFYQTNGGYEDYNGWYDILWKFQSFYDPDLAIGKLNENAKIDTDGDSFTFLYHWIYIFKELGKIDIGVYADTPYYAVFNKSGTRTYVAYNPEAAVKKVTFYGTGSAGSIYLRPNSLVAAQGFACDITTISADSQINSGKSLITIDGAGFKSGLRVYLTRTGQANIEATEVNYLSDTKVFAEFDLTGLAPGDWELIVVNPDGEIEGAKPVTFAITSYTPSVTGIVPNRASNQNQVRVQVTGTNFYSGGQIKLSRTGETDIVASENTCDSVTQVSGLLDVRDKALGLWNVVFTNADGRTGILTNGLELFVPTGVYTYPNPCKLSQHQEIYFANVPRQASLSIYDLNGDLVFTAANITANPFSWNMENTLGRRIASGIYVYVIQEGESLKKGKIAIIK